MVTVKAHKSVEQVAAQAAAVTGSLGIEACHLQYLIEAHRIVPGSCVTAAKPGIAVAVDDPWCRTALVVQKTESDVYRLEARPSLG